MKKLSLILSMILVAQLAQGYDQLKCQEFADGIRKSYDGHLVLTEAYCSNETYFVSYRLSEAIKKREIASYRASFLEAACSKENSAWEFVSKVNGKIYSNKNKELLNVSVNHSDCEQ